ncbi:hypothetical protein F2Q68_00037548 [Brassica cretica]|uniref:MIP18 family-like domain-containing protein n=1 Tax=Brassica cretica TaxID=69181 RepID=A0A8S9H8B0_BRACR|nr:hypothetical protein F2Q68_00037548 [Brassica cretica]
MLMSSQPNTCHHSSNIRLLPLSYTRHSASTKTTTTMSQTVHRLDSYLRSAGACLVSSPRPPPRRLVCIATVSDRNQSNVLLWKGRVSHNKLSVAAKASSSAPQAETQRFSETSLEKEVLKALSQIIDPDFGTDIVSCGFVKDLVIEEALGEVSFRLELTTPACPVKDMVNNDPIPLQFSL